MSKSETEDPQGRPARPADEPAAITRIDAAHSLGKPPLPTPMAETVAGDESVAEQLRTQADQLAAYLRQRQKELDHREAQVNARVARLERDARTARLWLHEREAELNRGREDLDSRKRDIQKRLGRLAASEATQRNRANDQQAASQSQQQAVAEKQTRRKAEADHRRAEAALQFQRQQLETRRVALEQLNHRMLANVERRRRAVEAHAAQLANRTPQSDGELPARDEVLHRTAKTLEMRQRRLQETEARLAEARSETQQLHDQLCEARRQAQQLNGLQRERTAAQQRQATAELEKQRQAVQRRGEHADRSKAALEQLRAELGRMHRETLEIRLATEELWVQLSGAAPPAALTRSLGRIRTKLADQYRATNAELQTRKDDLQSIRGQLAEQYEKVLQQKQVYEQWATGRREETEQQAARLIAREEQLAEREAELEDRVHRWGAEALDYRQEIRRLRSQVAKTDEVPVPA